MTKHKFHDFMLEAVYEKSQESAHKILISIAESSTQGEGLAHLRGQRAAYLDMGLFLIEEDKRISKID